MVATQSNKDRVAPPARSIAVPIRALRLIQIIIPIFFRPVIPCVFQALFRGLSPMCWGWERPRRGHCPMAVEMFYVRPQTERSMADNRLTTLGFSHQLCLVTISPLMVILKRLMACDSYRLIQL